MAKSDDANQHAVEGKMNRIWMGAATTNLGEASQGNTISRNGHFAIPELKDLCMHKKARMGRRAKQRFDYEGEAFLKITKLLAS